LFTTVANKNSFKLSFKLLSIKKYLCFYENQWIQDPKKFPVIYGYITEAYKLFYAYFYFKNSQANQSLSNSLA